MSDDIDERADALRFETRVVTPEDAAAVTAVLLAALGEQSADEASVDPGRSAWVRSGGAMRRPLDVGPGRWVRAGA
ncbi:acyl-CoA carboxylase epsilon subunit [Agromyces cerinus]|uniref:Acyl-CoA carboxylase epsilon subunit n=1 Tax=Agromyces cerinus subsp. cerinus TaxID=232089 RepID=A0A1N6DHL6_9MICO|nr:acyl-CoA carboxylase epsilon subunit [Agromyces cerinus]SIN70258.1 Acyl-CoA carboxylase epsilon subunit [Agromyces cerinus subsp. cerinus]